MYNSKPLLLDTEASLRILPHGLHCRSPTLLINISWCSLLATRNGVDPFVVPTVVNCIRSSHVNCAEMGVDVDLLAEIHENVLGRDYIYHRSGMSSPNNNIYNIINNNKVITTSTTSSKLTIVLSLVAPLKAHVYSLRWAPRTRLWPCTFKIRVVWETQTLHARELGIFFSLYDRTYEDT
jgi:hypothetical protein